MSKGHLSRFRNYAVRVRFLRGTCRGIPASVQQNVVTALARLSKDSLPLLPNLTELLWNELDLSTDMVMPIPLVKFFAGPRVTSLSLLLPQHWMRRSVRAVLSDLPGLCPNVTSFAVRPYDSDWFYGDDGRYILGDIVRRWPYLQVLQTHPIFMTELASMPALHTLNIEIEQHTTEFYVGKLPDTIHTFSLRTSSLWYYPRCLDTLQGSPTRLHLGIGPYDLSPSGVGDVFQALPTRFNNARLHALTIEFTAPPYDPDAQPSSLLTEALLASLYAFSALRTLDLNSFCTGALDDATYARMAATWPELRCLKMGTTAFSEMGPVRASVGAVIAVLNSCPHLQTLHIVFDGSILPLSSLVVTEVDRGGQHHGEPVRGSKEVVATNEVNRWGGISNRHITQIHVGHSPIREGVDRLKRLASCLRSVMPRLGTIRSKEEPSDVADRWRMVQHLLEGGDALAL